MDTKTRSDLRAQGYWVPNPGPQELTLVLAQDPSIFEIHYGGARGGGKTDEGMAGMTPVLNNPRARILAIRKNADDLADWIDRARRMFKPFKATFAGKPVVGRLGSGALIRTGHLKDDDAYTKYQGQEYHRILIEELTQINSEKRYLMLIASCRSTVSGLYAQVHSNSNPGGVGHLWVKKRFIEPDPEICDVEELEYHYKDQNGDDKVCRYKIITERETGMKRAFVPATIDDNPVLKDNDPNYVKQLDALKNSDPELYKAWRFGDWNIFAGQVFKEWRPRLNDKPYHVVDSLPTYLDPQTGLTRSILDVCDKYAALDWGYNDAFSCHWIAVTPENEFGVRRYFVYRELTGREERPRHWAKEIADIVVNEKIEKLIMPHDTYSNTGGSKPIATQFKEFFDEYGVTYPGFHISMEYGEAKSHQSKINRQALMHEMLAEAEDGLPNMQVLDRCVKLIETLPALPYSDTKPEEIDEDSDDHWYDSVTYGLYKILGGKAYVPKSELLKKKQQTFIITPDGRTQGLNIDIGAIAKKSGRETKDWRYR